MEKEEIINMTSLKEIIEGLRMKANQHYNPSMDGTRDERMEGRKEAYLDCANILEKWIKSIDETELDGLAQQYLEDTYPSDINITPIEAEIENCINDFKAGYHKAKEA